MSTFAASFACLVLLSATATVLADQDIQAPERDRAAVKKALRLLPDGEHVSITVIDPDLTGDPVAVRRLDAFIVREPGGELRQRVYINQESAILRSAAKRSDFHVKVLAAVICHELAHLRGLDEPAAARAEREFFEALMVKGLVPRAEGLAYLRSLRKGSVQ